MEEIVAGRPFERTSRTLNLTQDGEQLLAAARRVLDRNDIAVRGMLSRLRRLYPGVRLELMTGLSCELLSAYEGGPLDAVIAKKDGEAQRGRVI